MTKQRINIGQSANDKAGDPLRTAFSKVNDNFDELYNSVSAVVVVGATAPTAPGAGDLWWNSESGRMYVYYGTAWVDASPVDGAGISSTNQLVNGAQTVSLGSTGIITLPSSSYLESTDTNLKVGAQGTVTIRSNAASNLTTKAWTFGTDGSLTFPDTTSQTTAWTGSVSSLVNGVNSVSLDNGGLDLTFTSGEKIKTVFGGGIELYRSGDNTIGIYASGAEIKTFATGGAKHIWTFGTDGALTFPDNLTVVNGIIGKASTATITEGAASETTAIESQIEITTTGIVIAKRTSVTFNEGVITTVNDSGSTLELDNTHASITYYIEPDGPDNNQYIRFTTDSSAGGGATIESVIEDVGGTAHGRVRAAGNSVQVSAKTTLGTNKTWSFTGAGNLELPESGNILSNGANYINLANFETSYNNAEGAYQDALTAWMTLETFKPVWFALPGRLAYDQMILWTPTTGQPDLPPILLEVAKDAQDIYAAWQTTIALSKLTVASDIAEFDFNSTGKLRLSQGGTVGGGDQAAIDTAYDEWQADEAGWQYLITTGGADLNIRPWNFAGPSRAEKQAVVLSMWQAQQSGAAIDWVPISASFYNEARAWLAFTANQDGYAEWKKLTTSVNIASEDKTWTFTNDGDLTLPKGAVINETASSPGLTRTKYSGTFVLDPTWFVTNAGNLIETTTINGTIQLADVVETAFSFQYFGYFVPPTSANYTFRAHADETFVFWIGAKALSGYTYANKDMYGDYNGTFPEQQTQSFTIALTAGEFYPIRIQWANSAGWGQLDVFTWGNDAGQAATADFTGRVFRENTGTAKIAVNDNRSIILSTDNATDNNWTFAPNGTLTLPENGVLVIPESGDITHGGASLLVGNPDNVWIVDPSNTGTYVEEGSMHMPFKTITAALNHIETLIAASQLPEFDETANIVLSPQFIVLTSSTTEDVALTRGHIYIVGNTPDAGHVPIWIKGHVTITPRASTGNAKATNDFGLFHVAVLPTGAYNGITVTGSNPCRVYLEDVYVYQGNSSYSAVLMDNTGTGSKLELVDCHLSRDSGTTHLLDIVRGYCKIDNLETNGIGPVMHFQNASTGTMLNSVIDSDSGAVITLANSAAFGMGNCILNNTSASSNSHGVTMSGTATMQFGVCTFNVPVGDGSNRAINGTATNVVLYTGPVFQYGSTNKISTAITLIPLTTTFSAV